jgi:hypothetical protein
MTMPDPMPTLEHLAAGSRAFEALGEKWAAMGPPIIVFNKSHSGSRLLARLLLAHGVFLGAERNESEDAFGIFDLVRPLVEKHYPDYSGLMRHGDPECAALAETILERHLRGRPPAARWGWKLCETLYALPVLSRIFPTAAFVHLIRDGRDVAFSDHVAPRESFWRKVYFDTDRIERWHERGLGVRAYRRAPHIYNARHWVNSVTVARHYGSMIGENYLEVRYEDLVLAPRLTAATLLAALGIPTDESRLDAFAASVDVSPVGRHRLMSRRLRSEAEAILRPTLEAFGYGIGEEPPYWPGFWRR